MTHPPMFVGLDLGQRRDPSAMVAAERRLIDFDGSLPDPASQPQLTVVGKDAPIAVAHGKSRGVQWTPPERTRSQYVARHVQRFELETDYPSVVSRVAALFVRPQYAGQWLVVDQTGVGAAVVDMFRRARGEAVRCPKCLGRGILGRTTNEQTVILPGGRPFTRQGEEACLTCVGSGRIRLNARVAAIHIRGEQGNERWRYDAAVDTYYVAKRELISVLLVLMESNPGRFVIDPRLPHAKELAGELANFRAKRKPDSKDESLEAWRSSQHDDLVLAAAMCLWFAERASKKPWMKV